MGNILCQLHRTEEIYITYREILGCEYNLAATVEKIPALVKITQTKHMCTQIPNKAWSANHLQTSSLAIRRLLFDKASPIECNERMAIITFLGRWIDDCSIGIKCLGCCCLSPAVIPLLAFTTTTEGDGEVYSQVGHTTTYYDLLEANLTNSN